MVCPPSIHGPTDAHCSRHGTTDHPWGLFDGHIMYSSSLSAVCGMRGYLWSYCKAEVANHCLSFVAVIMAGSMWILLTVYVPAITDSNKRTPTFCIALVMLTVIFCLIFKIFVSTKTKLYRWEGSSRWLAVIDHTTLTVLLMLTNSFPLTSSHHYYIASLLLAEHLFEHSSFGVR